MKTRTEYRVEVKTESGYEHNLTTANKRAAENRSKDLAVAGYDGRIVTARGHVVQEWTIER